MTSPQNININSATIRLTVNNDAKRIIEFNPEDVSFIESFYNLIQEFEKKTEEFKGRDLALSKDKTVDKYGIPQNAGKRIALTREICTYLREKIDELFGEGTSNTSFGNINNLDMFAQFFQGIMPFIEDARSKKTAKYLSNDKGDVME